MAGLQDRHKVEERGHLESPRGSETMGCATLGQTVQNEGRICGGLDANVKNIKEVEEEKGTIKAENGLPWEAHRTRELAVGFYAEVDDPEPTGS